MRSLSERIIHTALFELIAVVIATPAIRAWTGASTTESGLLSVLISLGAMASNYVWTMIFDRWVPTRERTAAQRFLQAAGLELVIAAYTIPLTMWITGVSFRSAIALDAAALVFFLVYGIAYNAIFDAVMRRIEARRPA